MLHTMYVTSHREPSSFSDAQLAMYIWSFRPSNPIEWLWMKTKMYPSMHPVRAALKALQVTILIIHARAQSIARPASFAAGMSECKPRAWIFFFTQTCPSTPTANAAGTALISSYLTTAVTSEIFPMLPLGPVPILDIRRRHAPRCFVKTIHARS